jgi:hypothetical protein
MDLEYPVAELEPLAFILGRLLNQLCARLSVRGRATQELRLALGVDAGQVENNDAKSPSSSGGAQFPSSVEEGVRGWCQITEAGHHPGLRTPLLSRGGEFPRTFDFRLSTLDSCKTFDLFSPRAPRFESRALRLPVPTRDPRLLLKLWMLELETRPPSAPVLKLAFTAEPTRPRVAQGDLFLPRVPDPQKLELTLARLRGVVGEGKAGSPELLDTHRPDAFRMVPFGESKIESQKLPVKSRKSKVESQAADTFDFKLSTFDSSSTLRRFRPPLEASVEIQNGCPVRLESHRVRGRIVSAAGPWRSSGGWWTSNPWEHEEWDVEIAVVSRLSSVVSCQSVVNPQRSAISRPPSVVRLSAIEAQRTKTEKERLYRVYCDLKTGKWFVSGLYD